MLYASSPQASEVSHDMTVKEREKVINSTIEEIEELDRADAALESGDGTEARQAVERARALRLKAAPPVPVSVAARMLGVSEPTVRDWADRGLLEDADPKQRPRTLSLESVLRVQQDLSELRSLGRDRELRDALLARIDDRLAAQDPAVLRALRHAKRGTRKHYVHRRAGKRRRAS